MPLHRVGGHIGRDPGSSPPGFLCCFVSPLERDAIIAHGIVHKAGLDQINDNLLIRREQPLCDGLGIRPRKGAFFCSIKSRSCSFLQDRGELVDLSGTAALELGDWYVSSLARKRAKLGSNNQMEIRPPDAAHLGAVSLFDTQKNTCLSTGAAEAMSFPRR